MDVIALARKALAQIKEKHGLPSAGFLAGGSLANTMWSLHTGKPGPVNDIDIFSLNSKLSQLSTSIDKGTALFGYKDQERRYFEDYTGMTWTDFVKDLYVIDSSESDGIFNRIGYRATTEDPAFILKAFDLNCVKVGYHIEKDEFYISEEFKSFLETGKIKIINLMTPAHTALRLAKKARELEAEYDEMEIKLATHAIYWSFPDSFKRRFKEKYSKIYEDEKSALGKYFELRRDRATEEWVMTFHGKVTELYELVPTRIFFAEEEQPPAIDIEEILARKSPMVFQDDNLYTIHSSKEFLFYMRNVYGTEKAKSWGKLHFYFKDSSYLDDRISPEDAELLHRVAIHAPAAIDKLSGMSATEQISTVRSLLDAFKEDPIVAISILEKGSFRNADVEDELTRLLLELGVRKEIVNDTRGKAKKILG